MSDPPTRPALPLPCRRTGRNSAERINRRSDRRSQRRRANLLFDPRHRKNTEREIWRWGKTCRCYRPIRPSSAVRDHGSRSIRSRSRISRLFSIFGSTFLTMHRRNSRAADCNAIGARIYRHRDNLQRSAHFYTCAKWIDQIIGLYLVSIAPLVMFKRNARSRNKMARIPASHLTRARTGTAPGL